jgi:hypothetical protein
MQQPNTPSILTLNDTRVVDTSYLRKLSQYGAWKQNVRHL